MTYTFKHHPVEAKKITKLAPLVTDSQHLLSPDAGLTLVLEDGSKVNWFEEPGAPTPHTEDYFVVDAVANASFVVPAATFSKLFAVKK